MTMLEVPSQFRRPWQKHPYWRPGPSVSNGSWFEHYVKDRGLKLGDDWIYVPITWGCYRKGKKWTSAMNWLRKKYQKGRRYLTVCSHPRGLEDIKPSWLTVAGYSHGDVLLPLVTNRTETLPIGTLEKKYKSNFIGSVDRHTDIKQIRSRMVKAMPEDAYLAVNKKVPFDEYYQVLQQSEYTFSPRGNGPSSYRMYEALAAGSVPVYIWEGKCCLPFADQVNWDEIAVIQEKDFTGELPARDAKAGMEFFREFCTPEQVCIQLERIFQ